jgi:hypothetical protein
MSQFIVLDLDECLVRVFTNKVNWNLYDTLQKPEHLSKKLDVFKIKDDHGEYWGLKRPHLTQFLKFCFNRFKFVCVWSAGAVDYVEAVVAHIFRDTQKPHLVLTRAHIIYELDQNYAKPLEIFFSHVKEANKTNTLLLDNQHLNSRYDPHNILHIPEFAPRQTITSIYKDDVQLLNLIHRLDNLKPNVADVRDVAKQDIFNPLYDPRVRNSLMFLKQSQYLDNTANTIV